MFVVKDDVKNTMKLVKVKTLNAKKAFIAFLLISAFMLLSNLIPAVVMIFKNTDAPNIIRCQDFSVSFFIATIIAFIILNILYRTNNDYLSVFPQSNTSRFLSTQIYSYLVVLVLALCSLTVYLIQLGILKIISALFVPIVFLLDFNIAFVLTGFFAFIVYGLIFVSVFNLIGALIRKFRIYAIIFFIAVGTALIINLTWSIKAFSNIFGFLFSEKSIAVFFLKGIVLFIIINALSFVINYNTVYYKSNKNSKQLILIFSVTGLLIVVLFSLFIGILPISDSAKNEYNGNTGSENSEYLYTSKEITIDISHLKKGSIINIITNDNIIDNIDNYDSSSSRYRMFLNNPKSLEVTDGKLVVSYNFPLNTQNGKNITALTNPTFKAELKGNNLYLEYEYTRNIKAVINPVWSMIMQFKSFSDKNVYYSFFMSSESSGSGNVFVQCGEE